MKFDNGIQHLLDVDYFALDRVSQSSLKAFRRSPQHYLHYKSDPFEPTAAMKLGSNFDLMIFDPSNFRERLSLFPSTFDRRTKESKSWIAAQDPDRILMSEADHMELVAMKKSLFANKYAASLLAEGSAQVAFIADFEGTSGKIGVKGKIDFVPPFSTNCLVDLKTTADASPRAFGKKVFELGYHIQAAFYLDFYALYATRREAFVLLAVETAAPYLTVAYNLSAEAIELGRRTYTEDLNRLITCIQSGVWGGYSEEMLQIDVPVYLQKL